MACLGILVANAIPSHSQGTTAPFRYVIPAFSSTVGPEVFISNLSSHLVSPEIVFLDAAGLQVVDTFLPIPAGAQQRFTAASFGLPAFGGGTVLIQSPALRPWRMAPVGLKVLSPPSIRMRCSCHSLPEFRQAWT
jgi:hypothetical protein